MPHSRIPWHLIYGGLVIAFQDPISPALVEITTEVTQRPNQNVNFGGFSPQQLGCYVPEKQPSRLGQIHRLTS